MSSVQEFYSGQTVFLTGATGFLGKLVIEKLLRSCPDVKKIYLLVRPKLNRTLDERFGDIFTGACFDKLKSSSPDFLKRVHLLNGDCSQEMLGLSPEAIEIMKDEVSCVIHAAANVRFDIDLRTAVYTNVRSVRDLLNLAKEMKEIKSFVYVSTAFSHCVRKKIGEEFYEVDVKPEELLRMIEIMDNKVVDVVTPHLLGEWPNTYVYTKALAEEVIRTNKQTLPVTIVRPAIVTSSLKEPVPGWIDNFHGVVGVILGTSLGVLRSLHLDKTVAANLVPADFVVNAILASAWNTDKKNVLDETPIYNITPHKNNSVNWDWVITHFKTFTFVYPLSDSVWFNYIQTSKYRVVHKIRAFFYHTLFAYLVDAFLFVVGKRTLAVEKYRKIDKLVDMLAFFTTNDFQFECENVQLLCKGLDDEEKETFNCNMRELDWRKYLKECVEGGRIHLMKDPLETIPRAKRKMHLLRVVHYAFVGLVFYFWYSLIVFIFRCIFF